MSIPTRSEYKALLKEKAQDRVVSIMPRINAMVQSQPALEKLTGEPTWNLYLSYLQTAIEGAQAQFSRLAVSLTQPLAVGQAEAIRTEMVRIQGQIQAWEAAASLPKDLIKAGEQAAQLLDRLPETERGSP